MFKYKGVVENWLQGLGSGRVKVELGNAVSNTCS